VLVALIVDRDIAPKDDVEDAGLAEMHRDLQADEPAGIRADGGSEPA
jgi:hypothetical protein